MEDIVTEIKKLEPEAGDIILVRVAPHTRPEEVVFVHDLLCDGFKDMNYAILVLGAGFDLSVASERVMNHNGWYRHRDAD